ncbi:MAG: M28 family peptidase [Thermoleophilaceae bacterium]
MIEPLREIEKLAAFEGRGAGTDAERRAAEHLRGRLEELGRDAEVQPISVRPNWPVTHALHALLAILGSVLSVDTPVAGAAILAFVAVSAFGDLTGSFLLLRRLTGRRASQNVLSAEDGDKPGTLVLVAHYDTGRGGAVFSPRAAERRAVAGKLLRRTIGPFEPFFWSIVVVLACAVVRLFDIDALALTVVQFIFTVILIVSVPLLMDIALSGFVRGANDNASGVATVLRLAERYGGTLDHFDVWVLFTGAEKSLLLGMREWLARHRRELDRASTIFLDVNRVGHGTPRYTRKQGFVVAAAYHPALLELCEEIDEGRPVVSRGVSDAHLARMRGYPALSVSCLNAMDYALDRVDEDALERGYDFCCELVELVDERIGPDLAP